MKKYLPILFLMVSAVGLSPAYAVNFILAGPTQPGSANCEAFGGAYQSPRICVIETATIVWLQSGNSLIITSSWTLQTEPGGQLLNSGTIDNSGLIENYGAIHNGGTIVNDGTIDNHNAIDNEAGASFTNNLGGSITNGGTLTNASTLTNNSGASITNESSGVIHNYDVIVNDGAITNNGVVYVYCAASIFGVGSFTGNDPIEANGPDSDGDGVCDPDDCNPSDGTEWAIPGSTQLQGLMHSGGVDGITTIVWTPGDPGGTNTVWEALVSFDAFFLMDGLCLEAETGENQVSYTISPASGELHFILARGWNSCGSSLPQLSPGCPW